MAFPPAFLDELNARNPIEDVVGQYVNLRRSGSNLFGLCPFHGEKTDLRGIPGSLPDLSVRPTGCVFAPRCPYATDKCRESLPQLVSVGDAEQKWQVACHLVGGE